MSRGALLKYEYRIQQINYLLEHGKLSNIERANLISIKRELTNLKRSYILYELKAK
jgi:hypothetical protein